MALDLIILAKIVLNLGRIASQPRDETEPASDPQGVYRTERQKAHRDLLLRELPDARLTESLGEMEGTIAYDHVRDRFGVTLGNRPPSFFGREEIVEVQRNLSDRRLVFLTVKEWGQERDFVLRFATRQIARKWQDLLEERMRSCLPAGIRGPRQV